MATPYVCSESSRVGEMIITPVPEREEGRRVQLMMAETEENAIVIR